jgi:hypothetical protein
VKFRGGGCKAIVHPEPFPTSRHQPGPAEVRQVTRNFRLRHFEHRNQIANARFAGPKHIEQTQPRAVRECSKHQINFVSFRDRIHIRIGEYSMLSTSCQSYSDLTSIRFAWKYLGGSQGYIHWRE